MSVHRSFLLRRITNLDALISGYLIIGVQLYQPKNIFTAEEWLSNFFECEVKKCITRRRLKIGQKLDGFRLKLKICMYTMLILSFFEFYLHILDSKKVDFRVYYSTQTQNQFWVRVWCQQSLEDWSFWFSYHQFVLC